MDQKRKRTINKFALVIVLLILIPELVGHTFFDKPHSANSSVNVAVSLTNKMNKGYPIANFGCHLAIQDDPSSSNITRAAGLEGKYGKYDCSTG
ncbi:MAG TPA: hypothetical protein VJ771_03460 [Candidatus Nitrosotalea sp.]|nr:hypothetical protein [Candidatus Nitrosotalea sp.]